MHFRAELQRLVEQVGVLGKLEAKGTGSVSKHETFSWLDLPFRYA